MSNLKKILALMFVVSVLMCCSAAFADEWNCPECGALNSGNFCTQCGTKRPEEIICPNCGEKYPLNSGVIFCGQCGTKLQQDKVQRKGSYESNGFDTPEDAVKCYLDGLKNLDFEQMLSAFAWETQAKNYSVKNLFERMRAYSPSMPARIPPVNDFMLSANVHSIRDREINSIYYSIEAYCLGYPDDFPKLISLHTNEEVEEFLKKFSSEKIEKFSKLSNVKFLSPDAITDNKYSSERNKQALDRQRLQYGADELVDVPAIAEVGNEMLFCCPTVVRYGKRWYIASLSSNLTLWLNIDTYSRAFRLLPAEILDKLIK